MKKYFNLLCGIVALLCFITLYMPVIVPRFPAGDYIFSASAEKEYVFSDNYYWAREYWSVSRFLFSMGSPLPRVLLSLTQVLLIYWAWLASRGEAGKLGVAAAVLNLLVTVVAIVLMFRVQGACRWAVLIMMAVDCVAAVVLSVLHSGMKDPPKYISVPMPPK